MLEVLGHRVLVKPKEVERKTSSGIVLAIDDKRERMATQQGEVVGIGPNAWKAFDDGVPWVKLGDTVLFPKYAGKLFKDPHTEEDYFIINDEDIMIRVKD